MTLFNKTISSTGIEIASIGIGTWEVGGRFIRDYRNDESQIEALRKAVGMGFSHIDTAEVYGNGHAEEIVAEAVKGYNRKDIFITSKVWSKNLDYTSLLKSAEQSLKRLKSDYFDLYLIHAPNNQIQLKETMKAMSRLVDEKTTRWIGVSNFNVSQMKEAQYYCNHKVAANQLEYNLTNRNKGTLNLNVEKEIYPYCLENDILFIAWRPLAKGVITKLTNPLLLNLSKKYNKTITQLAINWLVSKKNIVTIPKATQINHLEEIKNSLGWSMDANDYLLLDNFAI